MARAPSAAPPAPPAPPSVTPPTDENPVTASGAPPENDLTPHVEGGTGPDATAGIGGIAPPPPPVATADVSVPGDELEKAEGKKASADRFSPTSTLFDDEESDAPKNDADKSSVELAEDMADANGDMTDEQLEKGRGKTLANGRTIDDTFIGAYKARVKLNKELDEIDGMSTEDRLRRIESHVGLRSPRQ